MKIVDIPADAVEVRDLWIRMPDGVRLHARVWLPRDAEQQPVPALLEYLPYRLDDWTSVRDSERHPYYAAHGYASVRVDVRGSGSSEGLFEDEYSPAELDDGVAVVEWLAAQPWCSGEVGMFGISWGGFNALQIAERAPEPLKAIVTVCSTDDRYDNDVHYIGGAVLGVDMAAWAGTMLAFASRPPRPEVVGDRWVEQWRDRLEQQQPLAPVWLGHQERDDYWRHGSVCENYGGIRAAVLAVGGWSDPYRDTVLRLLRHLEAPAKGIIGPWSHQYPDRGLAPGPGIGFLQETLRWWDRWLKGIDTGVENDPALRAWVNDPEPPAPFVEERSGAWVGVPWHDEPEHREWALGDGRALVRSPWATGQDAGRFFPFGNRGDLPPDQRAEDGRSICLDLEIGETPIDLLGNGTVRLRVRSTHDRGHVIVRLCDVAPDGSSTLVTRGVLNLLKRDGMDRVSPLEPGEDVDVEVPLISAGYRFATGHRLRVALSNHYWPWVWPHAVDDTLEVDLSASSLRLPLVDSAAVPVGFEPPEHARPLAISVPDGAEDSRPERLVRYDVARGETVLEVDPGYGGTRQYPDGLSFLESAEEVYTVREGDPSSPRAESHWRLRLANDGWAADVETWSTITCDAESFIVENRVLAHAERGAQRELVADRVFRDVVPRTST
ncbi:CocE/NonD family hydrolase [Aeromicrobium phragmitis]|uniref:CocE/NonD family hydrolase n=1 Tax=Aeromicrobium phragmitis TaxID=2478914 RepID=A0A3L8PLR6_9ACTN|nr:CocE/NonD family hydrolase [Aeromicrobium phragmitis]RLV56291.1 CocE/NonD family hydrolase [Aeromicrobium phragmitis]